MRLLPTILPTLMLIAMLACPGRAEVCFDPTMFSVKVDTSSYVNEASTKTLKADILNLFYKAREAEDKNRLLWFQAAGAQMEEQDENQELKARLDESRKVPTKGIIKPIPGTNTFSFEASTGGR